VQMQELLQGGVQKLEQHPDNWLHTPDCKACKFKKPVLCADAGVAARWNAEA